MNFSESFTSQEFAAALKHLKPGKVPGPDPSYPCWACTEVLVVWLPFFLPAPPQNPKRLEKSTGSGDV